MIREVNDEEEEDNPHSSQKIKLNTKGTKNGAINIIDY